MIRPIIFPKDKDYALVDLGNGEFAKIDIEDAEEVGKYNWCQDENGYAVRYENTYLTNAELDKKRETGFLRPPLEN